MLSSSRKINLYTRIPLFVFYVIALGLSARLRAMHWTIASVNLGVAAATIGLVFTCFAPVGILFMQRRIAFLFIFCLDFITFALTVAASGDLTKHRGICHEDGYGHCGLIRAAAAFFYMGWIILLFVLIFELYQYITDSDSSGMYGREPKPMQEIPTAPATA